MVIHVHVKLKLDLEFPTIKVTNRNETCLENEAGTE